MGPTTPGVDERAHLTGGSRQWVTRGVSTALIIGALSGLAYWGHLTGWVFFTNSRHATGPIRPGQDEPRPVLKLAPATEGETSPFPGQSAQIEFPSETAASALGIDINLVWPTPLTEQVSAPGEVSFDSNRIARLSARSAGVARQVFKASGDSVRAGELLALVESPDLGRAKAEFRHALVQAKLREKTREDINSAQGVVSPAQLREAEAAVKESAVRLIEASQALTNLGLQLKTDDYRTLAPAEVVKRLRYMGVEDAVPTDAGVLPANLLPVRAPFAGVLLSADAVTGEVIEGGKTLFVLGDPSRVWITLHVSAEDARRVQVGQTVLFRPDGIPREHSASLVWAGTAANATTRTVPVRAEAENPNGSLRASTLGKGRVIIQEHPKAVVVPHEAIQTFRGQTIVFVRDPDFLKTGAPKVFHVRSVRTGARDERNTEILSGVSARQSVATKGSAALLEVLARATSNR